MNQENLLEKPIWQMTGEQFIALLKNNTESENANPETVPGKTLEKKYVYGIRGIANLMDCSISTANRVKKSGIIDEAIIQNGRKIIVDSELALELIKNSK